MSVIGEWGRRVWYLLNRRRHDAALRREMDDHRASMADPARFGNSLRLREDAHDVWGWRWLDQLGGDLRLAARTLRRTPGFTVVTVTSLAIGFALVAATVAVMNAYVLRSLPYANADRLYHVMYAPPGPWEPGNIAGLDWTSVADVVEAPIMAVGPTFYLTEGGFTQSIRGLRGGLGLVQGLGVEVSHGRTLEASDYAAGAEPAALLGYPLWRDRYGADPSILGRRIRTEPEGGGPPESFLVVGVLKPDFYFGRDSQARVDLLVPLTTAQRTYMVKLRQGVPPEFAAARLTEAVRRIATGITPQWSGVRLESAHERYVGQLRPVLQGVTLAAGLVLVVVCANLAVLLVLRTLKREKEIAVRAALGAERRHIARMLIAEGALLCVAALGAGLLLTDWALGSLAPIIETELGRPAPGGSAAIALDLTVLLIVGGLGLTVALGLPFLPLVTSWHRRLAGAVRVSATATDGHALRRLRGGLIAVEVAGALVLCIGCGLLLRSVQQMLHTDLGFNPGGLVRARIVLRAADHPDGNFFRFFDGFSQRLSATINAPVAFSNWPPFVDHPTQLVEIDGPAGETVRSGAVEIGGGYFTAMQVPVREGRELSREDGAEARPVAVVSETLARRLWPGQPALGRRVRAAVRTEGGSTPGPWRTVVGVVGDVRQEYPDPNVADIYVPITPESAGRFGSFYVRTPQPLPSLMASARAAAAGVDPRAVVDPARPVLEMNRQLAGTVFVTSMLTAFAAIAGGLALLGIYGVTAYGVQQRHREIAIRMALGAPRDRVVRLFLRDGLAVIGVGLVLGLIAGRIASRVLAHQLYAVAAFDPVTLTATCALLASAGVVATWWPARRASRTNPLTSLKEG